MRSADTKFADQAERARVFGAEVALKPASYKKVSGRVARQQRVPLDSIAVQKLSPDWSSIRVATGDKG